MPPDKKHVVVSAEGASDARSLSIDETASVVQSSGRVAAHHCSRANAFTTLLHNRGHPLDKTATQEQAGDHPMQVTLIARAKTYGNMWLNTYLGTLGYLDSDTYPQVFVSFRVVCNKSASNAYPVQCTWKPPPPLTSSSCDLFDFRSFPHRLDETTV